MSETFRVSRQAIISTSATSGSSERVIFPEIVKRIYAILEIFTAGFQPFIILMNNVITKNLRFTPIDARTRTKYMRCLVSNIESKLSLAITNHFVIVFYSWTVFSSHYTAIFATLSCKNNANGTWAAVSRFISVRGLNYSKYLDVQKFYQFYQG